MLCKKLMMEGENSEKKKRSIFKKLLERYLSISEKSSSTTRRGIFAKSRSWHSSTKEGRKSGSFSVYVGPEKQRFVIKTEFVNHPLFKMLLEDAELEYGFQKEGPLVLPCDVDLFCRALAEMDSDDHEFGYGNCSPLIRPMRRLGSTSDMAKGVSSYGLLKPSRSLKINRYL